MKDTIPLYKRCMLTASVVFGFSLTIVPVMSAAAFSSDPLSPYISSLPSAASSTAGAFHFTLAFQDAKSGKIFVNATSAAGEQYIIFKDTDNKWYKLPKGYNFLWKSNDESLAHINLSTKLPSFDSSLWGSLLYDEAANTIQFGKSFILSPGRGFGLREQEDYVVTDSGTKRMFSVWLQDRTSGVVREIWRDDKRGQYRFHWTGGDQLLTERYNEEKSKSEILKYDVASGEFKPFLDGQIWRINTEKNSLLYIDNSEQRSIWIYDFNTGEQHKANNPAEEFELFAYDPLAALPSIADLKLEQLNIEALPEVTPQFVSRTVAELIHNGNRYPLPYAIVSGDNNFIPVSAILKPLNLKLETNKVNPTISDSKSDPADLADLAAEQSETAAAKQQAKKEYILIHEHNRITLTPEQIRIHDNRIFISLDVLKAVTKAANVQLQWLPPVGVNEEVAPDVPSAEEGFY